MRLYCLDLGAIEGALRIFDSRAENNTRTIFPVNAYLMETDDGKNILFDLGVHPGGIRADSASYRYQTKEQTLEAQLALCGKKPEDIDCVILSHLHYDHAGYLFLFREKPIYVNQKEYDHAFSHPGGAYCRKDYDVGAADWRFVNEDTELFPGITAVQLPGHSPGHLGLLVRLSSGNILCAQDALYSHFNDFPDKILPGLLWSRADYEASLEKIRVLHAQDPKLTVFYGHDSSQNKKYAPECYS